MSLLSRLFGKDRSFDELFLQALRGQPAVASVERAEGADEVRVVLRDGMEVRVGLSNLRRDYELSPPEKREEVIRRQVATVSPPREVARFDSVRDALFPLVRNDDLDTFMMLSRWTNEPELRERPATPHFFWRELCEGLGLFYGIDSGPSVRMVVAEDVRGWRVGEADLLDAALANLRRITPDPPREFAPGIFGSSYGDHYDASRAILSEWIARAHLASPRLIAVPNRDVLLIGNEESAEILLAQATEMYEKRPGPVSRRLYVSRVGGLEPYVVAHGQPLYAALHHATLLDHLEGYEEQKKLLDRAHAAKGIDIFVSSYLAFRSPSGDSFSLATWSRDVHAYLCHADRVAFESGGGKAVVVPWASVVRIAGHRMHPVGGLHPPRWEVDSFPDPEELERLEHEAVG